MTEEIDSLDVVGSTDAALWARFWLQTLAENPVIATDEGTMIGWFANAIMAGVNATEHKYMLRDAGVESMEEYVDKVLLGND